ncbi:MAG: RIP metalloprotease RseP [Chitinivibrionia bacterium]|nr:RIP metalloprotease RseP [Chitinivibrionia bacterium]
MINMILGIFVLGILVFIHELGHFLAAKFFKMPVLAFSIGFGPRIFSKKIGETVYQIAAIPFGGFVALEGQDPKDGEKLSDNAFCYHPIWQRAVVAFAGPAFNVISAYIFLVIVFMNGVPHAPYLDTNVVGLVSQNSVAYEHVQRGDKIISINENAVENWVQITERLGDLSPRHSIVLLRDGDTVSTNIAVPLPDPRTLATEGSGIFPPIPPVIGRVEAGSAAYLAGFLGGDSIISINGENVLSWFAVSETISNYDYDLGEISVAVARDGVVLDLYVVPKFSVEHERFMIGIVMANPSTQIKSHPFGAALVLAYRDCIRYSVMIFETLRKLITRLISPEYLSGPVGIMQMSGAAAQSGLSSLLQLMAIIGINLAILNLMPLVITDGGILSMLLIEAIRGKPIPNALREKLSYIVMIGFLCLALFVTFNDIMRFSTLQQLLR